MTILVPTEHATEQTPPTEETPKTVTVTAANLLTVLLAARPFTDNDNTLPVLRAILIEAGANTITATATNRYIIGHARKPASGELPEPVLISRGDAKRVVRMLRDLGERGDHTDVAIYVQPSHIAKTRVTFATTDASITVSTVEGQFPDVGVIFAKMPTLANSKLDGPIGLNPMWFKAFDKVKRLFSNGIHGEPCRLYFGGPATPVRVEVSDWFVGLVMPVRSVGGLRGTRPVGEVPNVPYGLPLAATMEG